MPFDGSQTWYANVNEDGSFSILARVCSIVGAGTLVRDEEGYCLTQADISTITCKVYDLGTDKNNSAGVEVTPAPTLTPAANVYDTLQTVGWDTDEDSSGYNFRHDVTPTYVPDGGEWALFEYKITLTGGGVIWLRVKVKTIPVQTS